MKNKAYSLVISLATILLSMTTGDCFSQAFPFVDTPIKVRDMEYISEAVEMTPSQIEQLVEIYDRYARDFAVIRKNEIQKFEDALNEAMKTMNYMDFEIPPRETVENLIPKAQRAMKATARVDGVFFDSCSEMLTEKQNQKLLSFRIARELSQYETVVFELFEDINDGATSNLQLLYDKIGCEPDEEIMLILETYNKRQLKGVKSGFNDIVNVTIEALDQVDELGINGLGMYSLSTMFMSDETALEDLKRRAGILLEPLIEGASEMSQLNWKTWKQLDGLMQEEDAQQLQFTFFKKSFRSVMRSSYPISSSFTRALNYDAITPSQKNNC